MTAGSGIARPGSASGHCRVTVVAPTRRVDVALPEDVPLAELLPELLRLVGAPVPAAGAAALSGYVLTGLDGTALDTAATLSEQGVVHGGVLRLRPAGDVPEAAVHDDIADAVAEAVLAGGTQWSTTALRATALTVVGIAAGLGAVVLWSSGTGTFHGWKGVIAGIITLLLFSLGVLRARYDPTAVGRGSYYGYGDEVSPERSAHDGRRGPGGRPVAAARLQTATASRARYGDEPRGPEGSSHPDSWDGYESPYSPDYGSHLGGGYDEPGGAPPDSHYSPDLGTHYGRDPRDRRGAGSRREYDDGFGYGRDPRDQGYDSDSRYGYGYVGGSGSAYGRDRDPGLDRDRDSRFSQDPEFARDHRQGFGADPGYSRDLRDPGYGPEPRQGFDDGSGYGRDPRDPRFAPDPRHGYRGAPGYGRQPEGPSYGPGYGGAPGYGFDPRYSGAPGYGREHRDPRFQPRFSRGRFLRSRRPHPSDPDFAAPAATFDLSSFGAEQVPGQRGATPRTVGATTVAHATASVRTGGLGGLAAWPTVAEAMAWATGAHHQRDYTAASVLVASSFPYAFITGAGLLSATTADGHGLGRVHFTAGAIAVLIVALAAVLGLGRRVAVPVAGATVGLVATLTGVGLQLTKASPAAGIAIAAAACAMAVELLPFAAMAAARFIIEPPTSGVEPGDFDGSPVNNYAVGLRVARTLDTLTGLTAGVGTLLVLCVALLVVPIGAMQTAPEGTHTVWEQALALLVSGVMLCRARLFRERAQVLAVALSGLTGLVVAFGAMAANADPAVRALWLAPLLVVIALLALGLASIRPRRGTTEPILPPRWSRTIDLIDGAVFLAVLPVLMAVLGVYGQVRNLKG
ncbi:MAG: hypothetical protein HOW97_05280 [Catenulispora sp.]|nr:hypothetical protein [Catenulispora sp.]